MSFRDLAAEVHLSPTSVAERVRRLEARGVIQGYGLMIDQSALGRPLEALIDLRIQTQQDCGDFSKDIEDIEDILEAYHITGRFDLVLRVACSGAEGLDDLLRELKKRGAVETETRIVLRRLHTNRLSLVPSAPRNPTQPTAGRAPR